LSLFQLADLICEFLEVAIHQILFVRSIYPKELFERKRKYTNAVVWMSRHPELNDYIADFLQGLNPFLQSGLVEKVAVLIKNNEEETIERFVFDMAFQQQQQQQQLHHHHQQSMSSSRVTTGMEDPQIVVDLLELEQELQNFLMTILFRSSQLKPIPQGTSFSVVVYLQHSLRGEMNEECQVWVTGENYEVSNAIIKPLKSYNSPCFKFQLYAEENREKK